ncbi:YcxB family protein [Scatolibacter rhodanostii]|uniref:YcxB family protein n=1 Tax=Scatolibacter rhodanostii TaxID=2014781 RepID=UPI0013564B37|nr:YcxB family protein [Scatolibacter rhodanostii]
MNLKKTASVFLAGIMVMMIPLSVSAAEFKSDDFEITAPDNLYTFTEQTALSDPNWTLAGISDPVATLKLFKSSEDEGMNAIVDFIGEEGSPNVLVTKKTSKESWDVFNLSEVTEEKKKEFLDSLSSPVEHFELQSEIVENNGITFISMRYDSLESFSEASEMGELHEKVYATIFNGYIVTFNTQAQGRDFKPEELDTLEKTAFSLNITNLITKEEAEAANQVPPEEIFRMLLVVGGFLVLIIGSVVFVKVREKKEKKQKKEMAERLSAYRKESVGSSEIKGEMLYANITDCSNEVLHTFSIYHAYIKNIVPMAIGLLFSILLVVLTIVSKTEWWMILVAIALFAYQVYRIAVSSSSIEKIQRKVYGQNNNKRSAKYAFYNSAFRVSGVQSAIAYPYFQVTDIRRYKDFFYIYYGPDNAYILDVNGFESGDKDTFYQFIKEKMEQK